MSLLLLLFLFLLACDDPAAQSEFIRDRSADTCTRCHTEIESGPESVLFLGINSEREVADQTLRLIQVHYTDTSRTSPSKDPSSTPGAAGWSTEYHFLSRYSMTQPGPARFKPPVPHARTVCLFVGCLTPQQHASVSQERICTNNCTCCHTETEVADQTFYITQSQYTDTWPISPSADPIMAGVWQSSH